MATATVKNPGLPGPPKFAAIEEERRHRKERLAASFRLFSKFGFDEGVAGHITARDPEFLDQFWVAPLGPWFGKIKVSDLVLVDHGGKIVSGSGPINRAGFAIHSAIHRVRPDVVAAAHSHSLYGKAWSTLGRQLDPITQDSCFFFEQHAVYKAFSGVVLDVSEGDRIAAALGNRRAIILQNHGLLTVGRSVESAVANYVAFENACQTQLLAEAAGSVQVIPPAVARHTAGQWTSDDPFAEAFGPLWEQVLREHPDLPDESSNKE